MDTISLVTINGSMFFVKSITSDDVSNEIDLIAQKFSNYVDDQNNSDVFHQFLQEVSQQLNIELTKVEVSHVYRINTSAHSNTN